MNEHSAHELRLAAAYIAHAVQMTRQQRLDLCANDERLRRELGVLLTLADTVDKALRDADQPRFDPYLVHDAALADMQPDEAIAHAESMGHTPLINEG